jgi:hypothetical protein
MSKQDPVRVIQPYATLVAPNAVPAEDVDDDDIDPRFVVNDVRSGTPTFNQFRGKPENYQAPDGAQNDDQQIHRYPRRGQAPVTHQEPQDERTSQMAQHPSTGEEAEYADDVPEV